MKMAANPHRESGLGIQPDPRTSIQQIHENFIAELASLSYEAKAQGPENSR
jgi:hypothetical protein